MLAYKWGRRCWRTSGGEDAGVQVGEKMLAYKWGGRCWRTSGGEDAGVQVGEKMLAYKWGRRCWRTSGGEDVPTGAVVGSVVDGKKEFVGRGQTDDQISPGRIVPEDGCMYTPYGGQDMVLTKYEALVIKNGSPIYEWVPMDSWDMPENAVPAGKDHSDTDNIYLGRVKLDGKLRFGKVHSDYQKVYVPD